MSHNITNKPRVSQKDRTRVWKCSHAKACWKSSSRIDKSEYQPSLTTYKMSIVPNISTTRLTRRARTYFFLCVSSLLIFKEARNMAIAVFSEMAYPIKTCKISVITLKGRFFCFSVAMSFFMAISSVTAMLYKLIIATVWADIAATSAAST